MCCRKGKSTILALVIPQAQEIVHHQQTSMILEQERPRERMVGNQNYKPKGTSQIITVFSVRPLWRTSVLDINLYWYLIYVIYPYLLCFFKISPAAAGIRAPSSGTFLLLKSSDISWKVTHSTPSCLLMWSMILAYSVSFGNGPTEEANHTSGA